MSEQEILSAEVVEEWSEAGNRRSARDFFQSTTVIASILLVLLVTSTFLYFFLEEEKVDYGASMEFDQDRIRTYAEDLVELGHPEWKGRMSGSVEEQATAEYIADLFEELGYQNWKYLHHD